MKIYTKAGDKGQTSLLAGGRVSKNDARLHAYGTIDELNAILGIVVTQGPPQMLVAAINRIQGELFTLGADLATPMEHTPDWLQRMGLSYVTQLEDEIDQFTAVLPTLQQFILPGGTPSAAFLHQARTVCRRAERWIVPLGADVNPVALQYTNRLSDWLFMAARLANHEAGHADITWQGRT